MTNRKYWSSLDNHIGFFIVAEHGDSKGFSLYISKHLPGNYKGVNIGLLNLADGDYKGVNLGLWQLGRSFTGVDAALLSEYVDGDFKGLSIGLMKQIRKDSKGVGIGLTKRVEGNSTGVDITGLVKYVKGDSKGINITGGMNYSNNVNDWLIEYATLGNKVKNVSDNAFVLQIGLYNRIGNQRCPIINVKGLKNISKVFSRKKEKK